jgi:hypothetical protein
MATDVGPAAAASSGDGAIESASFPPPDASPEDADAVVYTDDVASPTAAVAPRQTTGDDSGPIRRLAARDRQLYRLVERIAELELELRERSEREVVHDLELRSMQLDFELKAAYLRRLETDQGQLHAEIARLNEDRATLFLALEDTRRQLADASAVAAAHGQSASGSGALAHPVRLAKRVLRRVLGR